MTNRLPSTSTLLYGALCLAALGLAGCGDDVPIGEHDAGPPADGGEPCGRTTCGAGQVCCNASCGICTAPGEGCIAIACEDDGGIPDAGCGVIIECAAPPPGCHWEGYDPCTTCGTLVCDSCGGLGGGTCGDREYCDYESDCGFDDGTGTCEPRPEACPAVYSPVCGCDGNTYGNECEAAAAGVDALRPGECAGGGPCDPTDARGEGSCELFLGYAWDGDSCVGLSGCSCVGSECGALFDSPETCASAHAGCGTGAVCGTKAGLSCGTLEWCDYDSGCGFADEGGRCRPRPEVCPDVWMPVCGCDGMTYGNACDAQAAGQDVQHAGACGGTGSCAPMDARGVGLCAAFFGYAWNGSDCVGLSGCSCDGADCGRTYSTVGDCRTAFAGCPSSPPPPPSP